MNGLLQILIVGCFAQVNCQETRGIPPGETLQTGPHLVANSQETNAGAEANRRTDATMSQSIIGGRTHGSVGESVPGLPRVNTIRDRLRKMRADARAQRQREKLRLKEQTERAANRTFDVGTTFLDGMPPNGQNEQGNVPVGTQSTSSGSTAILSDVERTSSASERSGPDIVAQSGMEGDISPTMSDAKQRTSDGGNRNRQGRRDSGSRRRTNSSSDGGQNPQTADQIGDTTDVIHVERIPDSNHKQDTIPVDESKSTPNDLTQQSASSKTSPTTPEQLAQSHVKGDASLTVSDNKKRKRNKSQRNRQGRKTSGSRRRIGSGKTKRRNAQAQPTNPLRIEPENMVSLVSQTGTKEQISAEAKQISAGQASKQSVNSKSVLNERASIRNIPDIQGQNDINQDQDPQTSFSSKSKSRNIAKDRRSGSKRRRSKHGSSGVDGSASSKIADRVDGVGKLTDGKTARNQAKQKKLPIDIQTTGSKSAVSEIVEQIIDSKTSTISKETGPDLPVQSNGPDTVPFSESKLTKSIIGERKRSKVRKSSSKKRSRFGTVSDPDKSDQTLNGKRKVTNHVRVVDGAQIIDKANQNNIPVDIQLPVDNNKPVDTQVIPSIPNETAIKPALINAEKQGGQSDSSSNNMDLGPGLSSIDVHSSNAQSPNIMKNAKLRKQKPSGMSALDILSSPSLEPSEGPPIDKPGTHHSLGSTGDMTPVKDKHPTTKISANLWTPENVDSHVSKMDAMTAEERNPTPKSIGGIWTPGIVDNEHPLVSINEGTPVKDKNPTPKSIEDYFNPGIVDPEKSGGSTKRRKPVRDRHPTFKSKGNILTPKIIDPGHSTSPTSERATVQDKHQITKSTGDIWAPGIVGLDQPKSSTKAKSLGLVNDMTAVKERIVTSKTSLNEYEPHSSRITDTSQEGGQTFATQSAVGQSDPLYPVYSEHRPTTAIDSQDLPNTEKAFNRRHVTTRRRRRRRQRVCMGRGRRRRCWLVWQDLDRPSRARRRWNRNRRLGRRRGEDRRRIIGTAERQGHRNPRPGTLPQNLARNALSLQSSRERDRSFPFRGAAVGRAERGSPVGRERRRWFR